MRASLRTKGCELRRLDAPLRKQNIQLFTRIELAHAHRVLDNVTLTADPHTTIATAGATDTTSGTTPAQTAD